jgi:hypothetical protein
VVEINTKEEQAHFTRNHKKEKREGEYENSPTHYYKTHSRRRHIHKRVQRVRLDVRESKQKRDT